jgi:2-amino-4-hydroxy-6-hydroxymethyldihydropteridine diphosphokinase
MSSLALIGLGSNLGDRRAMLDGAIAALNATAGVGVRRVSSFHETEPVGGPPGQGAFLNAAAALETTLDPVALLHVLQAIETRFGRVRTVRWSERTLDLDLLLFDDRIIQTSELTVPHPRMGERRFVLAPLVEIAPEAIEPRTGRTVSELLRELDRVRP